MTKWVYLFDEIDQAEEYIGDWNGVRSLLGGKGANLGDMTRLGVPVPPGFTATTKACLAFLEAGEEFAEGMWEQILEAMKDVEEKMGKTFGDSENPLLVSSRSGAKFSMPGMMDTVLNIGLNDETAKGMIELTDDARFVYDSYRRLVQMYGVVVMGMSDEAFEEVITEARERKGVEVDADLEAWDWMKVTDEFKEIYAEHTGDPFPEDPYDQLHRAIEAAFESWNGERAVDYRNAAGISHDLGTGVNVQTMVFGNMGWNSGTGVATTRNISTGAKEIEGDYLLNAQGEDVVAGIRQTKDISQLKNDLPQAWEVLKQSCDRLERRYRQVQDVEFTIERGRLWILAARDARRTAYASLRFAIDFLDENVISRREAIFRVTPDQLGQVFAPKLPPYLEEPPIAQGLNVSAGVARGIAIFDADVAETLGGEGKRVILICRELQPDMVHGLLQAQGLIATRGGRTSHAALVSRIFNKPTVSGATISIDSEQRLFYALEEVVREGEAITVDGTSGNIYKGELPLVSVELEDDRYFMRYASLVWDVNSDDYVESDLGTLWLLRDTIKNRAFPREFDLVTLPTSSPTGLTMSTVNKHIRYKSFIQPPDAVIQEVLSTVHWQPDWDTKLVIWGIMDNLRRLLENEVGIGNHHRTIRPLTDPERLFVDPQTQSVVSKKGKSSTQLVGIEFFGVNHRLRNYLPWGTVQCWVVVRLSESEPNVYWRLDRTNPQGESILEGLRELVGFAVVLNDECLAVSETRRFYNELRKREFGWAWYQEKNTSWREVVGSLRSVEAGQPADQTMLAECQAIGLLTEGLDLTPAGYSLIHEQTAEERSHITFKGRKLKDGRE